MHRKIVLIMIVMGVLCICGYNGNILGKAKETLTAKDKLRMQDFQMGGLYLQHPITEAVKILGKPIKVKTIPNKDGFHEYDEEDYYFRGITIRVEKSNRKIIQMNIEDRRFKTFRGIKIGDKEEDVYYHYGEAKKINNAVSYWMLISQKPIDVYDAIGFHIQNGKVTRIDIVYVPSE